MHHTLCCSHCVRLFGVQIMHDSLTKTHIFVLFTSRSPMKGQKELSFWVSKLNSQILFSCFRALWSEQSFKNMPEALNNFWYFCLFIFEFFFCISALVFWNNHSSQKLKRKNYDKKNEIVHWSLKKSSKKVVFIAFSVV